LIQTTRRTRSSRGVICWCNRLCHATSKHTIRTTGLTQPETMKTKCCGKETMTWNQQITLTTKLPPSYPLLPPKFTLEVPQVTPLILQLTYPHGRTYNHT
jgi:hypothetical protein